MADARYLDRTGTCTASDRQSVRPQRETPRPSRRITHLHRGQRWSYPADQLHGFIGPTVLSKCWKQRLRRSRHWDRS